MKTELHITIRTGLALISALGFEFSAFSQDTTFTYQGRLNDNSGLYTGSAEFQPTLWTAENGGSQVAASSPATTVVGVTNGLFILPLDFGSAAFASGADRWLQLEVRTAIGEFTTLSPRQKLTPTPYALQAATAAAALTASNLSGTLPATQLTGTVADARLSGTVSLLGQSIESAEITDGTILNADVSTSAAIADTKLATIATAGKVADSALSASVSLLGQSIESAEITDSTIAAADVNVSSFNTTFWGAGGNSGTTAGTHFLGTTDNQPLELKVDNSRALRLEPNATSPNVIGGYSGNFVAVDIYGATIGGGGSLDYSNAVSAPYATIGGGHINTIQTGARFATIGGGSANMIQTNSWYATVGGGTYNTIQTAGRHATIGGGSANMIQTNSWYATVGGGIQNTIQSEADYTTVGGGGYNTIQPRSFYATIPGGRQNSATNYAFAAGFRAKANHTGAFVWADSANTDFPSTSNNQFNVRASGGVRLETAGAGMTLDGQPVLIGTVTSAGIADAAVTTSKLANGAVGSAQLADNSVTTAKILDGTILDADLSASAAIADTKLATIATAGKVANSALSTSVSLLGQSIESAEITDGTVAAGDVNVASFNTTFWGAGGNSGTTAGTHFLGTTDNQPLELKINGMRVLRLEDNGDSSDSGTIPDGAPNLIGGSLVNSAAAGVVGVTIAGGGATNYFGAGGAQLASADYATIGGGVGNKVETSSTSTTIAGGRGNTVGPASGYSAIGGGYDNTVAADSMYATIAGGRSNDAGTNSDYSTIGGGYINKVAQSSGHSTIAGGYANDVLDSSGYASIGGGYNNNVAGGTIYATIAGGYLNDIGMDAEAGTIAGGRENKVLDTAWEGSVGGGYQNIAGNLYATVPGGYRNEANGFYSFAAGRQAKANNQGSFVWGDSTAADVVSWANNSVTMRAAGGYRLYSSTDTTSPAAGVYLAAGASSWSTISDRTAKKDFAPVDGVALLEKLSQVPVQQWHYDWEEASDTPHIGPMAQDFKAAFYPGRDDKSISTLEVDGVVLAAIQGLNQKLERENAELRKELKSIKSLLTQLIQTKN